MSPQQSTTPAAEINRANSQFSGKKQSSLNALRHGLTAQIVVMPTEDLKAYQLHLASFIDEYDPQGATEAHLAQALADTAWRLNRVAALETNLLTMGIARPFDPFSDSPPEVQDAMSIVAALESQSKALGNLSMHSQRLSRQFESTVRQLRELQKTRRAQEKLDLNNLMDIMEMYESKGETYRPSNDGFVFSQTQINESMRTRNRERLIEETSDYLSKTAAA